MNVEWCTCRVWPWILPAIKSMILWRNRNAVEMQLQGLTLDIAGGNLLRLGKDGVILAASHGTRLTSYRRMLVFGLFGFSPFICRCKAFQSNGRFVEHVLPILIMTMIIDYDKKLFFTLAYFWCSYVLGRKMNDVEIERQYGRYRNKHITSDYALHLKVIRPNLQLCGT